MKLPLDPRIPGALATCLGVLSSLSAAQNVRIGAQAPKAATKFIRIEQQLIPFELGFEYTANRARAVGLASEFYMAPGGVDWNGDGDVFDDVIIDHDFQTGLSQVVPVDAATLALGDGFMAMTRLEASSEEHFNADGDVQDGFLFVRNNITGSLALRRPALSVVDAAGGLIDTLVSNSSAGIHELHSASSGAHRVFVAANLGHLDPFGAIYLQSELFAGDINGDGDNEDRLAVACSDPTQGIVHSGVSISRIVDANRDWVLCTTQEFTFGGDQNGDGDQADNVVIAMERATGFTRIVGVVEAAPFRQYQLTGRILFHRASEGFAGDQNGDGDTNDNFIEAINLATGQRQVWGLDGTVMAAQGNSGLVLIRESELGADVTGNGNTSDWIAHIADRATGGLRSLGFAGDPGEAGYLTEDHAVFALPESSLGTVLNGDGDAFDLVPIAITLATGAERIVPHRLLDLAPPGYPNGTIGFQLHEDFAYDLNGDGLATDRTAGVLVLGSGELTLAQGSGPRWVQGVGGNYLFTVDERILGSDVDGNGFANNWLGGVFVIR